jgi:hypothetical protein
MLTLVGCDKSSDDHVFTLYSSYQSHRLHVAAFDALPAQDNLFNINNAGLSDHSSLGRKNEKNI